MVRATSAAHDVLAGMVGVFRGNAHPPRQGTHVPAGTVIGSIDAMGILNPVTVEEEGYLLENRVEDGQPVEFGQVLFMLSREPLD
jgi:oxaloacetate decarboxylase (Na+ extruding) subunit alpha